MEAAKQVDCIPEWIKASVFNATMKEILPSFKQIKEFKTENAVEMGENFNTIVLRIGVECELLDGTSKWLSFILKTAIDNDMFRMMMKANNVFENETNMYKEVISEFKELYREAGLSLTFAPKHYELPTSEPNILLEDLSAKGFKTENRLEGLDVEHTEAVLKKLAEWHAASAKRVAVKGLFKQNLLSGAFREEIRDMMNAMFASAYPIFLQVTQQFEGHEEYFDAMCWAQKNMIDEMLKCSKIDETEFNVLNHGDCWSNNIMFQHDTSGRIKETFFIDYQMPKYGSPAQDLYYFLLTSTKYEIKIKQFDHFIKFYHEQLVEHLKLLNYGEKMPTLKDIHNMLYKYGFWGYMTVSTTLAAALLDPCEICNTENFIANTDAGVKLKMDLYSNPRYRQHLKLILPWLYNRGAFCQKL